MGIFATRNGDGASGLGEPANTIPSKASGWIDKDADRHGCDRNEFLTAPTAGNGAPNGFDPNRVGEN